MKQERTQNAQPKKDLFQEDFLEGLDLGAIGAIDLDFDLDFMGNVEEGFCLPDDRISKPVKLKDIPKHRIMPKNAAELVKRGIVPPPDSLISAVVKGSFEFGDMIGELILEYDGAEELILTTLSMSEANIIMLNTLIHEELIPSVTIVLSDYFYAHNRRTIYKFIFDTIPLEKLQVAVSGIHTKIALVRLKGGIPLVIEGSANLRSSQNVEQFCAINSEEHYAFHRAWIMDAVEKYKTIGRKGRYYGAGQ